MSFLLGSDVLFDRQLLRGRAIGLVCNPASVDAELRHVIDRAEAAGIRVKTIFGPQHGFRSDLQENMIETPHDRDARRQVAVYSLYSETREPTPEMLAGLDALVIDLQDVGTRIYTYVYTMANCLIAAARQGLPVVVCDRPNPIGGLAVEGALVATGFESFVGMFPIPMRHGMTIGELARLFNEEFGIGAKLEVIKLPAWSRAQYWNELGLDWVLPSPNIPTWETTVVYPGTVMLEGTNISEGRGTNKPFEIVGAPWADPERISADLAGRGLPGVRFRPARFEPTHHKHRGTPCGGCQIHVTDRSTFRPVETGVAVIDAFRAAGTGQFAWLPPPYEYEYVKPPIDILYGSAALREGLERGVTTTALAASWRDGSAAFLERRKKYLLY